MKQEIENRQSQCRLIYERLKKGLKLSSLYAAKKLNITSFHRRLTDLKRDPYNLDIKSEWHTNDAGTRYKRYYI